MKLIQAAHALTPGDAASNQVLAMDQAFRELGYETAIYANKFDSLLADRVQHFSKVAHNTQDILIYHLTTGTSFTNTIASLPYKTALYYHNITPARYFFGNAWGSFFKCLMGRRQLRKLQPKTFFSWAASDYSSAELAELGFSQREVLPIVLNYDEYRQTELETELLQTYQDGTVNLLMVGRVTPHKKQDEAIRAIAQYKQLFHEPVRLLIVGNQKPSYGRKLLQLTKELGVEKEVVFTGKVSFAALCTYYSLCDALLCLSEHEGFCVPLVESMIFAKPIVAYRAAAVPETIGGAGVLLDQKDPAHIAQTIRQMLHSADRLTKIEQARSSQLALFDRSLLLTKLERQVQRMIELKEQL